MDKAELTPSKGNSIHSEGIAGRQEGKGRQGILPVSQVLPGIGRSERDSTNPINGQMFFKVSGEVCPTLSNV